MAVRHVRLRGLTRMMCSMKRVSMRGMGMMSGHFMVPGGVMSGGFLVVFRSVLVMLGSLLVMAMRRMVVRGFFSHGFSFFC
jgi:hypothetical protein